MISNIRLFFFIFGLIRYHAWRSARGSFTENCFCFNLSLPKKRRKEVKLKSKEVCNGLKACLLCCIANTHKGCKNKICPFSVENNMMHCFIDNLKTNCMGNLQQHFSKPNAVTAANKCAADSRHGWIKIGSRSRKHVFHALSQVCKLVKLIR